MQSIPWNELLAKIVRGNSNVFGMRIKWESLFGLFGQAFKALAVF